MLNSAKDFWNVGSALVCFALKPTVNDCTFCERSLPERLGDDRQIFSENLLLKQSEFCFMFRILKSIKTCTGCCCTVLVLLSRFLLFSILWFTERI